MNRLFTRLTQAKTYFLAFLLATGTFAAQANDTGYIAEYQASYSGMNVGTLSSELTVTGNQYFLRSETTASGLAALYKPGTTIEESHLELIDGELRSTKFTSTNIQTRKRFRGPEQKVENVEISATLDWKSQITNWSDEKQQRQFDLKQATADRHSVFLQLRQQIKATANQALELPAKTRVYFIDKATVRHYDLVNIGEQIINTEAGSYNAVGYQRTTGSGRTTTFWLAKELDWHMVKFSKGKKGKDSGGLSLKKITLKP